jgi:hypothetical protein
MKSLLTAALLAMTMATPVVANSEHCAVLGKHGQNIMSFRQEERPLSELMKNYEDLYEQGTLTKEGLEYFKFLILHAYDNYEAQVAETERQNTTDGFRNRLEIGCFRAQSRKK